MRALAWMALATALAAGGCNGASSDACKGVAGTCVSLTVQSSTVATVDSLHIIATGALMGDQTSSGGRANLPVVVALKLPANTAGSLDLHVDGSLAGLIVGSCDTDTLVTPGQHANAVCTLVNVDNGGVDMSMGGGDDLTGGGGGPDMTVKPCDPKGVSGPQCVWRWQSPLPQGDDYSSVVAFTDSDTFALNDDGLIVHRDATAWSPWPTAPTAAGFVARTLFGSGGNSMDLFLAGGNATAPIVFHSSDRGATWTQETMPAGATGYVQGGSTVGSYSTMPSASGNVFVRDNVGTWTLKTIAGAATYYSSAMDFTTSVVVGYASSAAIAYSNNSGATWTAVPTANITPATASTAVLTGVCLGAGATNSWWAVGGAVILHASGTAPASWAQQGSAVTAGASLQGCIATDSTHAWAFGANGAVYVTTDGTNWSGVATPLGTTQTLNAGAHSNGTALTLVGTYGALYRSTNGGSSFTAEQLGAYYPLLTQIFGAAAGTVFAVGQAGAMYTTTDDGAHWTKLAAPSATGTTAYLYGVWASSATDVYAVGAMGTIVHSTNGTTFTKYAGTNAPPATTTFQDVFGSPTLGVYAVGYDAPSSPMRVIYRSTDHGATWAPVTVTGLTGAAGELLTAFALGGDVWIGGDSGVYHSTDGTTFTQQSTGSAVTRIRGVTGHLIGLIGNDPGQYITTTDKGTTWTAPAVIGGSDSPQNVAFVPDESAVYVFGSFGGPLVSNDKLATWAFVPTAMNPNLVRSAFAFAGNDVFIIGDTGIIHYGN